MILILIRQRSLKLHVKLRRVLCLVKSDLHPAITISHAHSKFPAPYNTATLLCTIFTRPTPSISRFRPLFRAISTVPLVASQTQTRFKSSMAPVNGANGAHAKRSSKMHSKVVSIPDVLMRLKSVIEYVYRRSSLAQVLLVTPQLSTSPVQT